MADALLIIVGFMLFILPLPVAIAYAQRQDRRDRKRLEGKGQ